MTLRSELLTASEITKHFGGVVALNDVNFDLKTGEIHALLGHNGSGKSTLLKIIGGVYKPDAGSLKIYGESIDLKSWDVENAKRKGIFLVAQELMVFPHLSILDNILVFLSKYLKINKENVNIIVDKLNEYLKQFNVNVNLTTKMRDVSIAIREIIMVLTSILSNSKILLLDEITSPLSYKDSKLIIQFLINIKNEYKNTGIVFVTHKIDEALEVADRITILRNGLKVITVNNDGKITREDLIKYMFGEVSLTGMTKYSEVSIFNETILSLKNISTSPKLPTEVPLHNISLDLYKYEILGIFGPTGAGKTEVGRTIIGDTNIINGKVIYEGKEVRFKGPFDAIKHGIIYLPEDRRNLGLILSQSVAFNTTLSALNMLFKFLIKSYLEQNITSTLIKSLNIKTKSIYDPVNTLSGGNQQKVMLARGITSKPKILIFDEPTVGIDVESKIEIRNLILNLRKEGLSIIIISEEPEDMQICDRVIVMNNGRIVTTVKPDEINKIIHMI